MQPAAQPRPVRVIVEIDPSQVSNLVTQILHSLTPHASPHAAPRPEAEEKPEEEPIIDRVSDPPPYRSMGQALDQRPKQVPVPSKGQRPRLPPQYDAKRFYVGNPCTQGHRVAEAPFSIRYRSSHSCVTCEHLRAAARRLQRVRPPAPPHGHPLSAVPPVELPAETLPAAPEPPCTRHAAVPARSPVTLLPIESTHGTRPELPAHLAQFAFLSPIPCLVAAHHYRNSRYVLRYLQNESCVQCCTAARQHLAGD